MNVIDKRAPRGYTPSCTFCNDEGCPVCESTAAQRVAAKLADEEKREIVGLAKQFVADRGIPIRAPEQVIPVTGRDLAQIIMDAIEHGIMLERGKPGLNGAPPSVANQRFNRLEWE